MSDFFSVVEPNVKEGDKVTFREAVPLDAMISWQGPNTTGHEIVVPAGTKCTVSGDSVPSADAFICIPDDYDSFGAQHVREHATRPVGYSGYCLVVMKASVGQKITLNTQP